MKSKETKHCNHNNAIRKYSKRTHTYNFGDLDTELYTADDLVVLSSTVVLSIGAATCWANVPLDALSCMF